MFERIKFVPYMLLFERAYRSDDWRAVRRCFHRDATYTIEGSGSAFDGVARGRDEIIALFKRMLDALDRKFEQRTPGLAAWPRIYDGELLMPWRAKYTLRGETIRIHGTTLCRYKGLQIFALRDEMNPEECERWAALAATA